MRILLCFIGVFAVLTFFSCKEEVKVDYEMSSEDLDSLAQIRKQKAIRYDIQDILSDGKLTVLLENSTVSYYIYRGRNMGYEYEVLSQFAKSLGVQLEVVVMHDLNDAILKLNTGEGELVGGNLNITPEREEQIDFTNPFYETRQVLVQRLPEGYQTLKKADIDSLIIRTPENLNGINLHIFKNSSFDALANRLRDSFKLDFNIVYDSGYFDVESLIEKVSEGQIDYTIADENTAKVNKRFYPNIDIDYGTTNSSPIAFGVRKSSPGLKKAFDDWLKESEGKTRFEYLKTKYFKIKKYVDQRMDQYSDKGGGKISPYDDLIKTYAAKGIIDWRLIAAQMYQESKFNPNVRSWAGAFGLMQFMPATAKTYGIHPGSPVSAQISAGVRKMNNNYKKWLEEVPDSLEALKFTLASYNAGKGHVDDARRLAYKYGLDQNEWEGNVEYYMLLLRKRHYNRDEVVEFGYCRGTEPVKYVKMIMARYTSYKTLFQED